jgi:hypothetical protein
MGHGKRSASSGVDDDSGVLESIGEALEDRFKVLGCPSPKPDPTRSKAAGVRTTGPGTPGIPDRSFGSWAARARAVRGEMTVAAAEEGEETEQVEEQGDH